MSKVLFSLSILIFLFFIAGAYASTPGDINSCQILDSPGVYTLNQDIVNYSGTCFTISSDDVVLDGQGHSVGGVWDSNNAYWGISVSDVNNATIKNINIMSLGDFHLLGVSDGGGIYFSASNSLIDNVNLSFNYYGLFLDSAQNNIVSNIQSNSNAADGIYLTHSSDNSFSNINSNNNGYMGIELNGFPILSGNTFNNVNASSNNQYGIYLHSHASSDFSNINASSNGADGISLGTFCSGTFTNITSSYNNGNGISSAGGGIIVESATTNSNGNNGISIGYGGIHSLSSITANSNANAGLYLSTILSGSFENITTLNNTGNGLYLISSSGNIFNNIVSGSSAGEGIYLTGSSSNSFSSVISSGSSDGIVFALNSNSNTLTNITSISNTFSGITFSASNFNTLNNINASLNSQDGIDIINGTYNYLLNINANSNSLNGLKLSTSNNTLLSHITLSSNQGNGLVLSMSSNNNISYLSSIFNLGDGIDFIVFSSNNNLNYVISSKNVGRGLFFSFVSGTNNTFDNTFSANNVAQDFYSNSLGLFGNNYFIDSRIYRYFISSVSTSRYYFINSSFGQIGFLMGIGGSGNTLFADSLSPVIPAYSDIRISNDSIFVNISQVGFNRGANLTLYNLPTNMVNPKIYKDNVLCAACYNFTSLNAGTVIFNVSSEGSVYSVNPSSLSPSVSFADSTTGDNQIVPGIISYNISANSVSAGDVSSITAYLLDSSNNLLQANTISSSLNSHGKFSGLVEGNYSFYGQLDLKNGTKLLTETRNIAVSLSLSVLFGDPTPANNTLINMFNNNLQIDALTTTSPSNLSIFLLNQTGIIKMSSFGSVTEAIMNFSNLSDGNYSFYSFAVPLNSSNPNMTSEVRSFVVDATPPVLSNVSLFPSFDQNFGAIGHNFTFASSKPSIVNLVLKVYNGSNNLVNGSLIFGPINLEGSNYTSLNQAFSFGSSNFTFGIPSYNYEVDLVATDSSGNIAIYSLGNFTNNAQVISSSNSGAGSGGGSSGGSSSESRTNNANSGAGSAGIGSSGSNGDLNVNSRNQTNITSSTSLASHISGIINGVFAKPSSLTIAVLILLLIIVAAFILVKNLMNGRIVN